MADSRLIPAGIRDASCLAFNELIDRIGTVPLDQLLIYLVDNVTETALPHLAEQFSVTGYDGWALTQGNTDRRMLIKRAIELHRRKGTPWAVRTAVASLGFQITLVEWWQDDPVAIPYTCRMEVAIDDRGLSDALINQIEGLIEEYKPVRVHITTRFTAVTRATVYYGVWIGSGETIRLYPLEQG